MATSHIVKQGEHISRIAREHGFFDYRIIWDHPANAALKKKRPNPHVLLPGDHLHIPDKQVKWDSRPTDDRHTFRIAVPMVKLRLALRDFDNAPVANAACQLDIEGKTYQLTTNREGLIEHDIAPTAENGRLRVDSLGMDVPIRIGHLDPHDEETGWLGRLINIGYMDESLGAPDPRELRSDIEEFQCDFGLKVTGELDDATKAKLKELHGY